jgi:hypothetical protein
MLWRMSDVAVVTVEGAPSFPAPGGALLHAMWDGGARGHSGILDLPAGYEDNPGVDMDQLVVVIEGDFAIDDRDLAIGTFVFAPKGSSPALRSAGGCRLFIHRLP